MLPTSIIILVITYMAAVMLTPVARSVALRHGLTDRPDGQRKLHGTATPLGGGVVVFLVTTTMLALLLAIPNRWQSCLWDQSPCLLAMLLASGIVVAAGIADDRFELRARHKLLGQLAAVSVLVFGGLLVERVDCFGWEAELGPLAAPVTFFWLIGAINAVNLLDGMDGLASTLGIIMLAAVAVMAALAGQHATALVSVVFASALFGFLRHNVPPARIFLGDAGSMLIGLVVGVLTLRASNHGSGPVLSVIPLAIWTIPIFDSTCAILRRTLTGHHVCAADRGHLHHRILGLVQSNRDALGWLAIGGTMTSAAAVAAVLFGNGMIALAGAAALVGLCIATGTFGRVEAMLAVERLIAIVRSAERPFALVPVLLSEDIEHQLVEEVTSIVSHHEAHGRPVAADPLDADRRTSAVHEEIFHPRSQPQLLGDSLS